MANSIENKIIQRLTAQLAQANLDNTVLTIKLEEATAASAEPKPAAGSDVPGEE